MESYSSLYKGKQASRLKRTFVDRFECSTLTTPVLKAFWPKITLFIFLAFCHLTVVQATENISPELDCNLDGQGNYLPAQGDLDIIIQTVLIGGTQCANGACDFDRNGEGPNVGDVAKLLDISNGGSYDGVCVVPLVNITLSPYLAVVPFDERGSFSALCGYEDGSTRDCTQEASWSTSPSANASIPSPGVVSISEPISTTQVNVNIGEVSASSVIKMGGYQSIVIATSRGGANCALKNDGNVYCWGCLAGNPYCQNIIQSPSLVNGFGVIRSYASGGTQDCGVNMDGRVWCWGSNQGGEFGCGWHVGDCPAESFVPVLVNGLTDVDSIVAGQLHSCVIKNDRSVWCFGNNGYAQLGDGGITGEFSPILVNGVTDSVSLSAGATHTCALKSDGSVMCWGMGTYGQVGDGTYGDRKTPALVSELNDVIAISAGAVHACALKSDGRVVCWGDNTFGQLGVGNSVEKSNTPVLVNGLTGMTSIASGSRHSCALKNDGTVWCWGTNYLNHGLLGSGITDEQVHFPVLVPDLNDVVSISAGIYHTCAVIRDGSLSCWGSPSAF